MAKPSELVSAVSELLDEPQTTVATHDRNLVIAGLRIKGGRGPSTPDVTPRDAAHLITAVMGSKYAKDSELTVRRYSATVLHDSTSHEDGWRDFVIPELAGLPEGHSFVDAMEALLRASVDGEAMNGRLYELLAGEADSQFPHLPPPVYIEISVQLPSTIAHIRVTGRGVGATVRYGLPFFNEGDTLEEARQRADALIDRFEPSVRRRLGIKQIRQIDSIPIFGLGNLLAGRIGLPKRDVGGVNHAE